MKNRLITLYERLYALYGPQGWWPLSAYDTGENGGYHPVRYDIPSRREQIYEVLLGTILTQNSSWLNAAAALQNLLKLTTIEPENILTIAADTIREAIRPARYFNQKTEYIINITKFYIELEGTIPTREQLLKVKGVGQETADSMLLYGWLQPEFVIDAYTRRIVEHFQISEVGLSNSSLKKMFEDTLPQDLVLYMEYHALIVAHGKLYYRRKPYGKDDPLCGDAPF